MWLGDEKPRDDPESLRKGKKGKRSRGNRKKAVKLSLLFSRFSSDYPSPILKRRQDVVYEQEVKGVEPKGDYRAGIDVGLDEMLSVVSENPEIKSFIVSGKEIKAFNQWFNKERAKLRSQMDYLRNEIRSGEYEDTKGLKIMKTSKSCLSNSVILSSSR